MTVIKTIEDGWDCVPKLKEVVETYENAADIIYEINNCVRATELCEIVERLQDMAATITEQLEEIDEDQEFETVEEDDD